MIRLQNYLTFLIIRKPRSYLRRIEFDRLRVRLPKYLDVAPIIRLGGEDPEVFFGSGLVLLGCLVPQI